MKSENNDKIVVFMSLKTNDNSRTLSQLLCERLTINHYDKNNNTMWLYNKNDKIVNNFDLTDYEVKMITDKNKFIKYNDLS